jgi:TFIIF-interacting CTD phosphatase-like protein
MSDTDLSSIIQKIKSKKKDYSPLLPPQKTHKKVLVLDLDETLIHTTFTKPVEFDF